MAIDFSKPATGDNYSTGFVPGIVANTIALAQWLDSANTTITGTPPTFAKRYNRTATLFDEFNGTAWAELPLGYLKLAGGTLTGALSITTSGSSSSLSVVDTGVNGANIRFAGNGATTPNKFIRAQAGVLEFVNSAYSSVIASLTDAGLLTALAFSGPLTGNASSATNQSGGTVNATTGAFSNAVTLNATAANPVAIFDLVNTASNGVQIKMTGNGTTPKKWLRVLNNGVLDIVNDAYTATLMSLNDAGLLTALAFSGPLTGNASSATSAANVAGSGAATVATLTATGVLKGNGGAKGYGAITTTVTTGTPTGGTSGDFVLVY